MFKGVVRHTEVLCILSESFSLDLTTFVLANEIAFSLPEDTLFKYEKVKETMVKQKSFGEMKLFRRIKCIPTELLYTFRLNIHVLDNPENSKSYFFRVFDPCSHNFI